MRRESPAAVSFEKAGFVGSDAAFAEVRDEDASGVHHEGDAHFVSHLAEDVANDGVLQELAELVLNRGDGFALESRVVVLTRSRLTLASPFGQPAAVYLGPSLPASVRILRARMRG